MVDALNVTDLDLECKFEKDLVDALREVVDGSNWQCIGHVDEYLDKHCTVLYAINEDPTERHDNIAIFSVGTERTLYAIDTVCPHEGNAVRLIFRCSDLFTSVIYLCLYRRTFRAG